MIPGARRGCGLELGEAALTDSAQGSLPAGAAAALARRGAVSVLAVSGAGCHQQLGRLHLTLALFGGGRPAMVVGEEGDHTSASGIASGAQGEGSFA